VRHQRSDLRRRPRDGKESRQAGVGRSRVPVYFSTHRSTNPQSAGERNLATGSVRRASLRGRGRWCALCPAQQSRRNKAHRTPTGRQTGQAALEDSQAQRACREIFPLQAGGGPGKAETVCVEPGNDYALGRIVEYLSGRKEWSETEVLVTEDDAQSGVDHIDAHRTVLMALGPWIKQNYVSHANTSFPGQLKTIFRLLGMPQLN